jgi:iron complex transport system ATP-binding protein
VVRLRSWPGPNGAGKTTLLRALAGLVPFQGQITVDGESLSKFDPGARARRVTYVPQHSLLDAGLPVSEVVGQGRFAHRSTIGGLSRLDREAVLAACRDTDVMHLFSRPFDQLSYGERRRVLLARALATEAPVVLLDEPTASLDVRHVLLFFQLLRRLAAAGRTIVLVLHQLHEVAAIADDVLLLDAGKVAAYGPRPDVIAAEPIRRVYGVALEGIPSFGYSLCDPQPAGAHE